MSAVPAAIDTLPKEIGQVLADLEQTRFAPFDHASLAWLALPPSWTEALAQASGFPRFLSFLEGAERAKLCTREPERDDDSAAEMARTLAAMWPALGEQLQRQVEPSFEAVLLQTPDKEEGVALLVGAYAGDERRAARLLDWIGGVPEPEARARLLVQAALLSPDDRYLERAWASTAELQLSDERTTARVLLQGRSARVLGGPARDPLALLPDVAALADPVRRAGLLLKLAAPGAVLNDKLAAAIDQIREPGTAALYLSLAAKLAGAPATRAIEVAEHIVDTAARCRALAAIAVNCGGDAGVSAVRLAWAAAEKVQDSAERTLLLALTASQWALLDAGPAFALALELTPAETAAPVMLATLSAEKLRTTDVARQIAATIERIPLQSLRTRLLWRLAAIAPFEGFDDVVSTVSRVEDPVERATALLALLPRMRRSQEPMARELLEAVERTGDAALRHAVLPQIVRWLDEPGRSDAVRIATAMSPGRVFAVTETGRRDILEYLRRQHGALYLYKTAAEIARAILSARGVTVPANTGRWAELASRLEMRTSETLSKTDQEQPPTSLAGPFLTTQVRRCVDGGDTGSALSWIAAGRLLTPIGGGDVESAVLTAAHRVELTYRRLMDEQHLRRYLERAEQTRAFLDLIEGTDDARWALHYLGVGGVGKTMLLRHITARLAFRNGQPLATSRVDFDHISPEFPVRKPGQLLAELSDELRIYGGSSGIEEKFAEFEDRLLALHNELSAQPPPHDPLMNLRTKAFDEVCSSFADLLRQLPPPVILILDTCEELAKLEPVGSRLPSIDATFMVLERLHALLPSIRVVFAGRRLLAQSGDTGGDGEWRANAGALGERDRNLPEQKDYLRLHVIRGFTRDESKRFLADVADLELDAERRDAILDRSAEAGEPVAIDWSHRASDTGEARTNPFDVALYAEWLRESPEVTAETIRSGDTEPYVEMRIVGRLVAEPGVRKALPAAVLMRRFDEDMLRAIEPDPALRANLFRDLRGHEWTDAQRDANLDRWFLNVSVNLRDRLESYFSTLPRRLELDATRAVLAPSLDGLVRALLAGPRWGDEVNASRLEPALRLQSAEAASALWDAIDRHVTATGAWHWPLNVCPQLLGERNVAESLDSPLRAAIRATLNAAQLHLQPGFDRAAAWGEVARTASRHPDPSIGGWLAYRAGLHLGTAVEGIVGAARAGRGKLDEFQREQAAACLLARVYDTDTRVARSVVQWTFPSTRRSPQLALLWNLAITTDEFDTSEIQPGIQRWADWVVPDCCTDRARLEYLRAARDD